MTPKEEAEDLYITFYELLPDGIYSDQAAKAEAKKFATICVDRILDLDVWGNPHNSATGLPHYQEVRKEINKI